MSAPLDANVLARLLVIEIAPRLYRKLFAISPNSHTIEDVLASTFITVLRRNKAGELRCVRHVTSSIDLKDVCVPLFAYCKQVAIRDFLHALKHIRRCPQRTTTDYSDHGAGDPLERLIDFDDVELRANRCREVLSSLHPRHRAILLLSIDAPSHADMAKSMNVRASTIKALLFRARLAFAKRWVALYGEYVPSREANHG